MNWETFTIGFWHPFGAHGGHPDGRPEEAEEILQRKAREIANNDGWTLWSFQFRRDVDSLLSVIERHEPSHVYALCSASRSTVAPRGKVQRCRQYRLPRTDEWRDIPSAICVPHPFGKKEFACAFKVQRIIQLPKENGMLPIGIEWYSTKTKQWSAIFPTRNDHYRRGYPPRPEILIQRSKDGVALRPIRAVLELAVPYLATLKA
jgi:hypothetical protein